MSPLAQTRLSYMKLILNSFCIWVFFVCAPVFAENIHKQYIVKTSGIKIGKLDWKIEMSEADYVNEISLKSEGVLSMLYQFNGTYYSTGIIKNKKLKPSNYNHIWKTNKTNKNMSLVFQDDKLKSLTQKPIEKENLRINVFDIKHSKDPLTSFLQIIIGEKKSLVIDGRRMYTMNTVYDNKNNQTIIEISNYSNLWADHKRNKFEKLAFEKKDGELLPNKIKIYFDGRVFKLEKY